MTESIAFRIFWENMNSRIADTERLLRFAKELGGAFTLSDLRILFDDNNRQSLHRKICDYESAGLLKRYARGVYTIGHADSLVLSAKLRQDSYVSFGSALAYHRIIGTESPFLVSCVVAAKAKIYDGDVKISYSRISDELYFGFEPLANGVRMADPEKAVLDSLYFYQHGMRFYFNLFQDISFSALDREKFEAYLERYQNPKFRTFARRCFRGEV